MGSYASSASPSSRRASRLWRLGVSQTKHGEAIGRQAVDTGTSRLTALPGARGELALTITVVGAWTPVFLLELTLGLAVLALASRRDEDQDGARGCPPSGTLHEPTPSIDHLHEALLPRGSRPPYWSSGGSVSYHRLGCAGPERKAATRREPRAALRAPAIDRLQRRVIDLVGPDAGPARALSEH